MNRRAPKKTTLVLAGDLHFDAHQFDNCGDTPDVDRVAKTVHKPIDANPHHQPSRLGAKELIAGYQFFDEPKPRGQRKAQDRDINDAVLLAMLTWRFPEVFAPFTNGRRPHSERDNFSRVSRLLEIGRLWYVLKDKAPSIAEEMGMTTRAVQGVIGTLEEYFSKYFSENGLR